MAYRLSLLISVMFLVLPQETRSECNTTFANCVRSASTMSAGSAPTGDMQTLMGCYQAWDSCRVDDSRGSSAATNPRSASSNSATANRRSMRPTIQIQAEMNQIRARLAYLLANGGGRMDVDLALAKLKSLQEELNQNNQIEMAQAMEIQKAYSELTSYIAQKNQISERMYQLQGLLGAELSRPAAPGSPEANRASGLTDLLLLMAVAQPQGQSPSQTSPSLFDQIVVPGMGTTNFGMGVLP